ncbi:MAG: hypothetical protein AB7X49_24685, partial [Geminicoccaceae bacterium]
MSYSLSLKKSSTLRKLATCLPLALLIGGLAGGDASAKPDRNGPIMLSRSGGFEIGGKVIVNPDNPGQTLSCDHGYVEYFIPWKPRRTSLVMWHSSSSQVWQNRWDGGEGYKDKFLRRNYPVYLWDGPRVGRANWSCEPMEYVPGYRDQGNFTAWKFGPVAPQGTPKPSDFYQGVQFPINSKEA